MVSEFEFIDNIKSRYGLGKIGDDCAVLPKDAETDLLLTADMLVEDIDFRLEWSMPEFLGHKALAVSLSDIAAVGGTPKWAMLSIAVAENLWKTDFLDRFYDGWFALANKYGVELVGGDISRSPEKLVIDSIVGGEVTKGHAILRSTAKPRDAIYVSGTLGGAAGGLRLLEEGSHYVENTDNSIKNLLLKQLEPQPQLELANILQIRNISSAMLDVSDGLSSDLVHLCNQSNVGAKIYAEKLPINPDLTFHFPSDRSLQLAIDGGEDFELLFSVGEKNISLLDSLDVTQIGEVTANAGVIELIDHKKTTILEPKGYRHF
ncbi:MAG: thiamine-phosphate kinase [Acidobacteriota bacterium]